jgi:hypothetical protein
MTMLSVTAQLLRRTCLAAVGSAAAFITITGQATAQYHARKTVGVAIPVSHGHAIVANRTIRSCIKHSIVLATSDERAEHVTARFGKPLMDAGMTVLTFDQNNISTYNIPFTSVRTEGQNVEVITAFPTRRSGDWRRFAYGTVVLPSLHRSDEYHVTNSASADFTSGLVVNHGQHAMGLVVDAFDDRLVVRGAAQLANDLAAAGIALNLQNRDTANGSHSPNAAGGLANSAAVVLLVSCVPREDAAEPAVAGFDKRDAPYQALYTEFPNSFIEGPGDLLAKFGFSRAECIALFRSHPKAMTMEYNTDSKCNLWSDLMTIDGQSKTATVNKKVLARPKARDTVR